MRERNKMCKTRQYENELRKKKPENPWDILGTRTESSGILRTYEPGNTTTPRSAIQNAEIEGNIPRTEDEGGLSNTTIGIAAGCATAAILLGIMWFYCWPSDDSKEKEAHEEITSLISIMDIVNTNREEEEN